MMARVFQFQLVNVSDGDCRDLLDSQWLDQLHAWICFLDLEFITWWVGVHMIHLRLAPYLRFLYLKGSLESARVTMRWLSSGPYQDITHVAYLGISMLFGQDHERYKIQHNHTPCLLGGSKPVLCNGVESMPQCPEALTSPAGPNWREPGSGNTPFPITLSQNCRSGLSTQMFPPI